jgi:hypothetical protein
LNATAEVAGLLRGSPHTELDRGAWIIASGVLGCPLPFKLATPSQKLLHHAANDHTPREI